MTTDTDTIIALARKLQADNNKLRAQNTAPRAAGLLIEGGDHE